MKKKYYNWFLDFDCKFVVLCNYGESHRKVISILNDRQLIGILYNLMRKHYLIKHSEYKNCFSCER